MSILARLIRACVIAFFARDIGFRIARLAAHTEEATSVRGECRNVGAHEAGEAWAGADDDGDVEFDTTAGLSAACR